MKQQTAGLKCLVRPTEHSSPDGRLTRKMAWADVWGKSPMGDTVRSGADTCWQKPAENSPERQNKSGRQLQLGNELRDRVSNAASLNLVQQGHAPKLLSLSDAGVSSSHEVPVDSSSSLTAFMNTPDNKGLPSSAITSCENLWV